jgi:quercetin dioxygenase-like cupin family protein
MLLVGGLACCALPACHSTKPVLSAASVAGVGHALSRGEIRRTLIDKRPATNLQGWETRLYLIEYGPGAVAPLHTHPVVGIGFVLSGSFESAFGDEPVARVQAGHGFVDPAEIPHRVFRNVSVSDDLRFVVAYTIRPEEEIFHLGGGGAAALH